MASTLGRLATDLGERSTYDAASQCSRCGYCEQSCPTYKATGDEKQSPRGRNQLVRLILEGKLSRPQAAQEALESCLLCGACATTCYAHVPTADIVLEGRRLLRQNPPRLAVWAGSLLLERPVLFAWILKLAFWAKRLRLSRLARPILRRAGLPGLAVADEDVAEAPRAFSHELLARGRPDAAFFQFMPCGTRYLFPRVALATEKALSRRGGSTPLPAGCCGLMAYNYGALEEARAFARRVIETAEGDGSRPIVVDCSSCAAFLKSYEQLFLEDAAWRRRAKALAGKIKDAVEVFDAGAEAVGQATYHQSCRACHGQGLKPPPLIGAAALPLEESDACCGGAGAFSFTHPELSDEVLRRKISRIARTGADVVLASSTSCLIQLARGLKKYYPSCTVKHLSEIAAFSDGEVPGRGSTYGPQTGA